MNSKFLTMLGFCTKAGKCVFGEDAASSLVKSGKAELVLLSEAASVGTAKKVSDMCGFRAVPLLVCDDGMGAACGKPGRMIIAIADKKFANELQMLYTQ